MAYSAFAAALFPARRCHRDNDGATLRWMQDTARAMTQLRGGDIRPVMVTGDNHLTGIHIAREANMFFSPLSHGMRKWACAGPGHGAGQKRR
jgi:hypothetical protein